MSTLHIPFRHDHVGSFLRPTRLKDARIRYEAGSISAEQLKQIEDEEIAALIEKQKQAGCLVITDGEFRRSCLASRTSCGAFRASKRSNLRSWISFPWGRDCARMRIEVIGKISGEDHPFVEHFRFVKQFEEEGIVAKQTVPAPAQLLAELYREDNGEKTKKIYPDDEQLIQDIAAAYRTVIRALYAAGCRNLQLDDCTWGMLCDEGYRNFRTQRGDSLEEEAQRYLRVNALALEGRPADMSIATHCLPGELSFHLGKQRRDMPRSPRSYLRMSRWMRSTWNLMTNALAIFSRFVIFPPIRKWCSGSSRANHRSWRMNRRSSNGSMRQRRSWISTSIKDPQCGFASCEIGNKLTEEEQWAKLALVKKIAEKVWP